MRLYVLLVVILLVPLVYAEPFDCSQYESDRAQDECISKNAILLKDPSLCDTTSGYFGSKSDCYSGYVKNTSDLSACDGNRPACYSEIAVYLKNMSLCELVKEPDDRSDFSVHSCYNNYAIQLQDITACEHIPDVTVQGSLQGRQLCYRSVARQSQNSSACAYMEPGTHRDSCYRTIAQFQQDSIICDNIQDEQTRLYCYKETPSADNVYWKHTRLLQVIPWAIYGLFLIGVLAFSRFRPTAKVAKYKWWILALSGLYAVVFTAAVTRAVAGYWTSTILVNSALFFVFVLVFFLIRSEVRRNHDPCVRGLLVGVYIGIPALLSLLRWDVICMTACNHFPDLEIITMLYLPFSFIHLIIRNNIIVLVVQFTILAGIGTIYGYVWKKNKTVFWATLITGLLVYIGMCLLMLVAIASIFI